MAARRLIAVMLVLLFLSSLAAALAPVDPPPEEETTTTTTTTETAAGGGFEPGDGELLRRSINASNGRPPVIEGAVGDQLQLRVSAERAGTIELVGIGADEDVDPQAPALFDVILSRPGKFPVRFLDGGPAIATIEVAPSGVS